MASVEKRTNQNGAIMYRVKIMLKGYPVQTASFERKTDARNWANATQAAIKEGRYFKTSASRKYTLGELIDRYIRDILVRKPKSISSQKTQLLWWKNNMGSYMLADLTSSIILEYRDKLAISLTKRRTKISNATEIYGGT